MKVFHHNDLDGKGAAAIHYRYDVEARGVMTRYIEMEYSKPLPLDQVLQDEQVVFLDFHCGDDDQFVALKRRSGKITIIDHHKTFKERVDNNAALYEGVKIVYDAKLSGCEIAWDYYCPDIPMPRVVKLIGDRDCWRWEFGEETARFCAGMMIQKQDPTCAVWDALFLDDGIFIHEVINEGTICLSFRDNICADYTKLFGWETKFEGYKCFANGMYAFGSEGFGERFKQYDICLSYEYLGDKWIVGLYSETVDVSEIAVKYGGGGHKGAAGFNVDVLPFTK